ILGECLSSAKVIIFDMLDKMSVEKLPVQP
ncbi:unnamed protein product, partial [marine sediment metagenome]